MDGKTLVGILGLRESGPIVGEDTNVFKCTKIKSMCVKTRQESLAGMPKGPISHHEKEENTRRKKDCTPPGRRSRRFCSGGVHQRINLTVADLRPQKEEKPSRKRCSHASRTNTMEASRGPSSTRV